MKTRWIGLGVVALLVAGVLILKLQSQTPSEAANTGAPQVVLVADMNEAGGYDECAKIISAVQAAQKHNIRAVILNPNSDSPLLRRYQVLAVPTVLFLDAEGNVTARLEGESAQVVTEVEDRLAKLSRGA